MVKVSFQTILIWSLPMPDMLPEELQEKSYVFENNLGNNKLCFDPAGASGSGLKRMKSSVSSGAMIRLPDSSLT